MSEMSRLFLIPPDSSCFLLLNLTESEPESGVPGVYLIRYQENVTGTNPR